MNEKVYTIKDFCKHYRISEAKFYKMQRENNAPKLLRIGSRILITQESAKEWELANIS